MKISTQAISVEFFGAQKSFALNLRTKPLSYRKALLKSLLKQVIERESEILDAHERDFRKPRIETLMTEIYPVVHEIRTHLRHLDQWVRAEEVPSGLLLAGCHSEIRYEPKGTVLIVAPWNYPFALSLVPLVSAIGAGNTVILKPSELTPHVSAIIENIISNVFSPEHAAAIQGGPETAQVLLELPFDHIFFTGSTNVGRLVMQKAAKNLSPVTLELGGKSPAIVHSSCDLKLTVSKILWGKCLNGGQTCVAPDYALIEAKLIDEFIAEAQRQLANRYQAERAIASIINERHFLRIKHVLVEAIKTGAVIFSVTEKIESEEKLLRYLDVSSLRIGPFLVLNPGAQTALMKEEIFGPILPIIPYADIETGIEFVRLRPKPLALYVFSQNEDVTDSILQNVTSGGVCINDTILHLGNHNLPFGGVGESGIGHYHGIFGFKTFSHQRAVLKQGPFGRLINYFYPPYNEKKYKLFRRLMRMGF